MIKSIATSCYIAAEAQSNLDVCTSVRFFFIVKVYQRFELCRHSRCSIGDTTTPEVALCKGCHVKTCYDTEIVGSTTECKPEVVVRLGVGIDDLAIGENDLEVEHVVTDEAFARREERNSTCSYISKKFGCLE